MDNRKDRRNNKTALEAAYAYLANRMRTRSELEKHLRDKGYSAEETSAAADELESMRYIDDYQYALRYYEYNREKKRGVLRGERELLEKGVDRETARNAKEDFLFENDIDEYKDALTAAQKELFAADDPYCAEMKAREFDDKLRAKIARRLESKGYEKRDIFRVLDALRRESDDR